MKTILLLINSTPTDWGDGNSPVSLLTHDDGNGGPESEFRGVLSPNFTNDVDGNIINPDNSNSVLKYNNGTTTAPVRLVLSEGDSSYIDLSSVFTGWTLPTTPITTFSNVGGVPGDLGTFFVKLNETVQNDGTDDYYEISLDGFTSNITGTTATGFKATISVPNPEYQYPYFTRAMGFMFFDKTTSQFETVTLNDGSISKGIMLHLAIYGGDVNTLYIAKHASSKDLTDNSDFSVYAGQSDSKRIHLLISGIPYTAGANDFTFECNRNGFYTKLYRSGTSYYDNVVADSLLSNIDTDNIILLPCLLFKNSADNDPYAKPEIETTHIHLI
jgi:hypothetical protein